MTEASAGGPRRASLRDYLKAAFLFRWNLLFLCGAAAAALISGQADVALPLIGAAELAYLAGLTSIPRFRAAIDAQTWSRRQDRSEAAVSPDAQRSLAAMLAGLVPASRTRFESLRRRCLQMRQLAHGVGGRAQAGGEADRVRTPALDRLLWSFLRLLYSHEALARFLTSTDADEIEQQLAALRARETSADRTDERILRSLRDSVATAELRLENYRKAEKNAEFVTVELDRIEGKISALTELSVGHADPNFLSSQVDSVADSMVHTEHAIRELQAITGLKDSMDAAPPILEADLDKVLEGA